MSPKISILSHDIANKIAAGEVIERPSSVVKELVENSIDAKAARIVVELEAGGGKLIRVSDNGWGMSPEDAVLSIQRHATSKISSADDLFEIKTLGFRGEAIPSIASVSHFELTTRTEEESAGIQLYIKDGEVQDFKEVGAPIGTTISVSTLFYNTPARLKFMKTPNTELGHISDIINRFALSHPEIGFKLIHGGREIFTSPGTGDLQSALVCVFGRETARDMVPIKYSVHGVNVTGYISKPNTTKVNRSGQLFYVNNRNVRNKLFFHAIDQGYHTMVTVGRQPIAVIFVDVDPSVVDVNVHPTKSEVKFQKEWEVHDAILKAIRNTLDREDLAPRVNDTPKAAGGIQTQLQNNQFKNFSSNAGLRVPAKDNLLHALLTEKFNRGETQIQPKPQIENQSEIVKFNTLPDDITAPLVDESLANTCPAEEVSPIDEITQPVVNNTTLKPKVIGQLMNSYILAETDEGLVIIDQHAAHERVLYEKLINSSSDKPFVAQMLAIPYTLELTHRQAVMVDDKTDELKNIGFDLEPFGRDSFIIRSVPAIIAGRNYHHIVKDIIDEFIETLSSKQMELRRENNLIKIACKRSAIKAGDRLSIQEMNRLIDDLFSCANPFTCAHGRPTMVILTTAELINRFKRT